MRLLPTRFRPKTSSRSLLVVPLALVSLLVTSSTNAQRYWTYADTAHAFVLKFSNVPDSDETMGSVYRIDVLSIESTISQMILSPGRLDLFRSMDTSLVFIIEDVNFDDHSDIRLLSWLGTSLYTTYWYWLFDPRTSSFVRDTIMDEFTNPAFDHEHKLIYTWDRVGSEFFEAEKYAYDTNGSLLLMGSQVLSINPMDPDTGVVTLQRRENGRLYSSEIEVSGEDMEFYKAPWDFR